ncbi:MAG TPA: hypothetical protein GXX75_01545 [Clostridiales bacterium]|nr:hypothetical protein [Clostridiales bacterium]
MMIYGNQKKMLKAVFIGILFILVASSCISSQHIALGACKNLKSKRVEEMKDSSYCMNKQDEIGLGPGAGDQEVNGSEIFDRSGFSIFLLIIKNLLTLFSKLIVILSFYQFFLYIKGWIILVSEVKLRFFVMRYIELTDGKKGQLVFQ